MAAVQATDIHSRLHFDEVEGTHWVRGRSYKASASKDGFTYIPFLGSEAPRNFPVQFRLESVKRSGASFDLSGEAEVRREGDRFVLDRGDVEVRYDLRLEEVEQSFAFDAPAGHGDVLLEISVATELQGSMDAGSLRFGGEYGGVVYSEAFVLDGAGRVASVPSRWDGGSIELTVPAAFVDAAQGPIIVDPLLSSELVFEGDVFLIVPDLAYDAESDRYLAVFMERFSFADNDILSIFISPGSFESTGSAYIDMSSANWRIPRVAQQRFTRRFLVVAEADSQSIPGSTDIVARFRLANGIVLPSFRVRGASNQFACTHPDIGGEAGNFSDANFCVVYTLDYGTDRDVLATLLDANGDPVGSELSLASTIAEDERDPSISSSIIPSGAGSYFYHIAWRSTNLNTGERKVEAVSILFDGSEVRGPFNVAPPSFTSLYFGVSVSNQCQRKHPVTGLPYYLVTFESTLPMGDLGIALCSGEVVHSLESLEVIEHTTKESHVSTMRVGTLVDDFIIAYGEFGWLMATILQPIGDRLGMTERRLRSDGFFGQDHMTIATTVGDGSGVFEDGMILWSKANVSGDHLRAALVTAPTPDAAGTQYCYGTPNSTDEYGHLMAFGSRNIAQAQQLFAGTLPPNSSGFFLASTTQGLLPGAGGSQGTLCVAGSIGRFGIYNSGSDGVATFNLLPPSIAQPTGTVAATSGESWNFQSWYRDVDGGVATSNFTNAVTVTFL